MRLFVKSCRGDQDLVVPKGANSGQGEGRRDEGTREGGEQKSSRKVAKTLRRNCAKFVGISAEIRQLPPSSFPSAHRATSFLERRGRARDEGRTALGDLTYHGNSPGRAFRIPSCPRSALHTHARAFPRPKCWPYYYENFENRKA